MGSTCPVCHGAVSRADRFCRSCGARLADPAAGTPEAETRGQASGAPAVAHDGQEFVPLPASERVHRRRRRRRPLYKRPWLIVPVALLLVVTSAFLVVGYRVGSVLSSMHALSTPAPIVTDNTFVDADDPDAPSTPISVDTGPARAALEDSGAGDRFAAPSGAGVGASLQRAVSGTGDLVGGAAVAAGLAGADDRPMTLLVMGVDARPGAAIDIGVRPDVLMLVRLDPASGECRMLSVPRDTRVELPGYGQSKINHALMVGGIPYQILVTEAYLGLQIDHYVLIDFVAFQKMVDEVGGITVDVPDDLVKNGETVFRKGRHHFTGAEALAYARYRSPSSDGDLGRVKRQWGLLAGVADALRGRDLVQEVNSIVPTLEAHLRTDLTASDMTEIAKSYGARCLNADADAIRMLDGNRIRFNDPIMDNQSLYYNVVSEATLRDRVDFLIDGEHEEPVASPAASPSPPVATPPATPGVVGLSSRPSAAGDMTHGRPRAV